MNMNIRRIIFQFAQLSAAKTYLQEQSQLANRFIVFVHFGSELSLQTGCEIGSLDRKKDF